MGIPIESPTMLRPAQPPRSLYDTNALDEFIGDQIGDMLDSVGSSREATAFPFPSISKLVKPAACSSEASKRERIGPKSRPSHAKLERQESTTSSSGGSGEQDMADMQTENSSVVKDIDSHEQQCNLSSSAQYHTREGYPKTVDLFRKFPKSSIDGVIGEISGTEEAKNVAGLSEKKIFATTLNVDEDRRLCVEESNINDIDGFRQRQDQNTVICSDVPKSPIQITTLPSIPKRSTYRVELQPGEILPESK